jgi:hypothetical protein
MAGLRWIFRDLTKAPELGLFLGAMLLLISSPVVGVCLFSTLPVGLALFFGMIGGAGFLIGLTFVFSCTADLAYPGTVLYRLTHLPPPRKRR